LLTGHPSKAIIGTAGRQLEGKRIVLGVTGSIAALRAPEVARELMRRGAEVYAVMTSDAQKIIHPYALEWATGNPVVTEITGKIEYVAAAGGEGMAPVDLVLVAPVTANTLAKIAWGISDTPVTAYVSAALGAHIPVVLAPAMHRCLWDSPAASENLSRLRALGLTIVEPELTEGKAKLVEVEELVEAVIRRLTLPTMAEMNVLVTAGPTVEYLDPIRVLTNRSSGRMGVALAREALRRGAQVTLVYGPGTAKPPSGAKVIRVETSDQMRETVVSQLRRGNCHVFFAAAAVSDFTPLQPSSRKLSTAQTPELTVRLRATEKLVEEVKRLSPQTFLVIFKAEYQVPEEELAAKAEERMKQTEADLVVANDVGRKGAEFGSKTTEALILDKAGERVKVPLSRKEDVAAKILDLVQEKLKTRKPE
jgi:phosphopantothenoylcysteine decarboxylase/phosphopantothenate--cysteine ligase